MRADIRDNSDPSPGEVLNAALRYVESGLSIIPVSSNKKPALEEWKSYQQRHATRAELSSWYSNGNHNGIGIVCGAISGGDRCALETIDIEGRAAHLLPLLRDETDEHLPGLFERLPIFKTPGGGYHLPYRCERVEGNQKLAVRIKTDENGQLILNEQGKPEKELLIETRGEGGYVATYPSPGRIHPTGGHYEPIAGGWLKLPTLSPDERNLIIGLCRSFNEYAEPVFEHEPTSKDQAGTRPGDDFNDRASWESDILGPHGWIAVKQRDSKTYWRKPGSKDPYHATTNHGGSDLFYCFSTNSVFDSEKSYSKFSAYVLLNYSSLSEGNFKQAAKDLASKGYGEQKKKKQRVKTPGSTRIVEVEGEQAEAKVTDIKFNLTPLGNAARLVHHFGKSLRYCFAQKQWYVWNSKQWLPDEGEVIQRVAKRTVQEVYLEAHKCDDNKKRKEIGSWARSCERPAQFKAMIEHAQSENGIPVLVDDLDRDPMLFNVMNGTIDLRTGNLKPHDGNDLITKISPVEYDPDATAPMFEAWILQMMAGDKELVEFLQRAIGYSLTGDVSEQCLFLCYGTGSNGKSTLFKLLLKMLGGYACTTPTETLMVRRQEHIPTDIAKLKGARLVTASEAESGRRLAEAKIKQMTGDDRLEGRFLFSKSFEYDPQFKLWIMANHKLVIQNTDDGIWRRIRLVPFTVKIPRGQQDKQLGTKLQAELPGILAWAVRGCLDWLSSGLQEPTAVRKATGTYKAEMDTVGDFLRVCCDLNPVAEIRSGKLYEEYKTWARNNGEQENQIMSNKAFSQRLDEKGFKKRSTKHGAIWSGIEMTDLNVTAEDND